MALPPLSTILNNAPLIIQGANQLLKMIREKTQGEDSDTSAENKTQSAPNTMDDLKTELQKINGRLDTSDESDIQQIQLIEALAKQNESLATSLQSSIKQLSIISMIAVIALILSIICLVLIFK